MTTARRFFSTFAVIAFGGAGVFLTVTPWVFLFTSTKSPLRVRDGIYISAFGLGVAFAFALLMGVFSLVIAVTHCKLLVVAARPAQ